MQVMGVQYKLSTIKYQYHMGLLEFWSHLKQMMKNIFQKQR